MIRKGARKGFGNTAPQSQMVEILRAETLPMTTGGPSFAKFTDADVAHTADVFLANGISATGDIKNLCAEAREMLIDDLGATDIGGSTFSCMRSYGAPFRRWAGEELPSRRNMKKLIPRRK